MSRKKEPKRSKRGTELNGLRTSSENLGGDIRLVLLEGDVEHSGELADLGLESILRRPGGVRVENLGGDSRNCLRDGEVEAGGGEMREEVSEEGDAKGGRER